MGVVVIQRKHADGKTSSWHVRWNRRRDDRPRCVYLGSWPEKKFAEEQRVQALYMLAREGTIDVDKLRGRGAGVKVSMRQLGEAWLEDQHVGEQDKRKKLAYVKRINERWGDRQPAHVTQADVQAWINELVKDGAAKGTIVNHLNVLRPLLRSAELDPLWLRGYKQLNIPDEAWEDMDLPNRPRREACRADLREGRGLKTWVSVERQMIFDVIEHGGLRTAEAVNLLWRQVGVIDGHPALLQIGTKFVRKNGKPPRNVRHMPELGQPMWVPVKPEGVNPDDRVFPREDPSGNGIIRAVARSCERANLPTFTPKSLRHLHATRLHHYHAKHTLGVHGSAKRMGHSQAEFLKRYSDHPLPDPD